MDFKAQLVADMRVFHNPEEMATLTGFWYDRKWHEAPAVLDHEAAAERQQPGGDNAPGVSKLEALVYVSLYDLGFMPERDHEFAVEVAGVYQRYNICWGAWAQLKPRSALWRTPRKTRWQRPKTA